MTPTTVLHNPPERMTRKQINDALSSGASSFSQVQRKTKVSADSSGTRGVTPKLGKRHSPYRRIVQYERTGPFYREVGHRWLHGERFPILQGYYKHNFLHASKGWRKYTGGERMSIPHVTQHVPASYAFYGRHAA